MQKPRQQPAALGWGWACCSMANRLRNLVAVTATIPDHELPSKLSLTQRSILPFLSAASSVYALLLFARSHLYRWGILRRYRLPVPVISVGNLTWGGNGKTPMVEFLARFFAEKSAVPPLVLTRGYAGGDEANMLQRHLCGSTAKISVGANRVRNAMHYIERHGHMGAAETFSPCKPFSDTDCGERIGIVIIDDGMQHWRIARSLDIVMVNGMMPWGNKHLLPRGPLREPLDALRRADIAVIHNADLVPSGLLKVIESTIKEVKELPIFYSRLAPKYFFEVKSICSKLPLSAINKLVVLCISGIGFPNAFIEVINELNPLYTGRLDFHDHHFIKANDLEVIKRSIKDLEEKFGKKPTVVVTEKDYDRDHAILEKLENFVKVLVLQSSLQFLPFRGQTQEKFLESVTLTLETSWKSDMF